MGKRTNFTPRDWTLGPAPSANAEPAEHNAEPRSARGRRRGKALRAPLRSAGGGQSHVRVQSHFTRHFRRSFGVTPSAYRRHRELEHPCG